MKWRALKQPTRTWAVTRKNGSYIVEQNKITGMYSTYTRTQRFVSADTREGIEQFIREDELAQERSRDNEQGTQD